MEWPEIPNEATPPPIKVGKCNGALERQTVLIMYTLPPKPSMVKILPVGSHGNAHVDHITLRKHQIFLDNLRYLRDGMSFMRVEPGKYARLCTGRGLEMTDTQMEWRTNAQFILRAHGDVLIAGLGIGLVLVPLLKKKEVKSIQVVELNEDVIKLVSPHFKHKKLTVVHGDIETHRKQINGHKFDTIYFDIWPDINTDNLEQMKHLCGMYRGALNRTNPSATIDCWTRDILRAMKRQGR